MGQAAAGGNKLPPRREYTLAFKQRIVEETFGPGQSVSIVARQHDVNANMLFSWRKQYREGTLRPSKPVAKATIGPGQDLIRIGVIEPGSRLRAVPSGSNSSMPSPTPHHPKAAAVKEKDSTSAAGLIEIELPNRVKLRVPAAIGEAALRRVLAVAGQLA